MGVETEREGESDKVGARGSRERRKRETERERWRNSCCCDMEAMNERKKKRHGLAVYKANNLRH